MVTQKAQLRVANQLSASNLKTISKFVEKQVGKGTELVVKIDQQLIAGFKLTINGVEYDHSLSGSLERLAQVI